MKSVIALLASVGLVTAIAAPLEARANGVQGFDISHHQPKVDYAGTYKDGARFVMIKVSCLYSFAKDTRA